ENADRFTCARLKFGKGDVANQDSLIGYPFYLRLPSVRSANTAFISKSLPSRYAAHVLATRMSGSSDPTPRRRNLFGGQQLSSHPQIRSDIVPSRRQVRVDAGRRQRDDETFPPETQTVSNLIADDGQTVLNEPLELGSRDQARRERVGSRDQV